MLRHYIIGLPLEGPNVAAASRGPRLESLVIPAFGFNATCPSALATLQREHAPAVPNRVVLFTLCPVSSTRPLAIVTPLIVAVIPRGTVTTG